MTITEKADKLAEAMNESENNIHRMHEDGHEVIALDVLSWLVDCGLTLRKDRGEETMDALIDGVAAFMADVVGCVEPEQLPEQLYEVQPGRFRLPDNAEVSIEGDVSGLWLTVGIVD